MCVCVCARENSKRITLRWKRRSARAGWTGFDLPALPLPRAVRLIPDIMRRVIYIGLPRLAFVYVIAALESSQPCPMAITVCVALDQSRA